ncbi:MAG: phenylalanine--tRNA ligase beta subunit-related protein [Clostridia bacterium]|nr:phenylalanine--tRNA ligase beta subunit-related protein [Clostridia bacterium]
MKYEVKIDERLLSIYPEIRLGLLRFQTNVKAPDARFWAHMDGEVLPQVRSAIDGKEWSEIPGIRGSRAAYKALGRNPGRYRVSSEALIRRVRRGDELYHINSVVDVNNLISVKSGLSVGSYDVDALCGTITLRKAEKGEGYHGIGKEFLDLENLPVLVDEEGVFGCSMSDSTRAMVTEQTKDVLVVIYCFENDLDLAAFLEEARQAFQTFAGAENMETWSV